MKRVRLAILMAIAFSGAVGWAQAAADEQRHPHSLASPPPAPAALSEATIRAVQEELNKQGIALKVDGVLNDETRAAIRKYQTQHHLPVTGEPDRATLDKLGVRPGAALARSPTLAQATEPAGSPPAQAPPPQASDDRDSVHGKPPVHIRETSLV